MIQNLLLPFIMLLIVSLDLWSKFLIKYYEMYTYSLGPIKFAFVQNYGFSNGLLSDQKIELIQFVTLFFCIILIFLNLYFIVFLKNNFFKLKLSITILVSAMLSNAIDRFLNNYVTDFIYFKVGNFTTAIFNLADSIQLIGLILFFYYSAKSINLILPKNNIRSSAFRIIEFKISLWIFLVQSVGIIFISLLFIFLTQINELNFFSIPNSIRLYTSAIILFSLLSFTFYLKIISSLTDPIYGLKRYITDLENGKDYHFKTRSSDRLPEIVTLAEKIRQLIKQ